MDYKSIDECMPLCLTGKIAFPDVIKKLKEIDVDYYIVNLVRLESAYFTAVGESRTVAFSLKDSPIARTFNPEGIQQAIDASLQKQITYETFLQRIMEAGCVHYEVYIKGRKIMYFGTDGSCHIQPFPGVIP